MAPRPNLAPRRVWLVMGPSGSGKSTLGAQLALRFGAPFLEGDAFHPAANTAMMSRGEPLDDLDRRPWLVALASAARDGDAAQPNVVVACSALKRVYRDILRGVIGDAAQLFLICPAIARDVLAERMQRRTGHFMPPRCSPDSLKRSSRCSRTKAGCNCRRGSTPAQLADLCLRTAPDLA